MSNVKCGHCGLRIMNRIIVVSRGGAVQDIYADNTNIEISVLDYDEIADSAIADLEAEIEGLGSVEIT